MANDWEMLVADLHREGADMERRRIAKALKANPAFTEAFICDLTKLDPAVVRRLKPTECPSKNKQIKLSFTIDVE